MWQLEFLSSYRERSVNVLSDSMIGFRAVLEMKGGVDGELHIFTSEHAMSAVNYPMTYKSFRIVNDSIAEIDKIQGLPRDWYAPFR
ncbi:hypothetical protein APR12_006253 [Nocardia amikacinitolerans]|nr:hypothetical protein [Nocardia amikacinitolerans]